MSEDPNATIRPVQAPLSHLDSRPRKRARPVDLRNAAVVGTVLLIAGAILLWQPWTAIPRPATGPEPATGTDASGPQAPGPATAQDSGLAPFAATQRQLTRKRAQDALAQFVETQIKLQESMQVDAWGANELRAALEQAREGDQAFLAERYEDALNAYQDAQAAIGKVVTLGERLFEEHLSAGRKHIAEFDPESAAAELGAALAIRPDHPRAQAELARAEQLPTIINLLRTARNHELGERFDQALATYARVRDLDPQTTGLAERIAQAQAAQSGHSLAGYLSEGFAALERRQFDQARQAFNRALAIEADNETARGGLEQVAKRYDLSVIQGHQARGRDALANEDWPAAIEAFNAILALDPNLQFAQDGLSAAQAHQRAQRLLTRITEEPHRLSTQKLYLEAGDILERAGDLDYQGPRLSALVDETRRLLALYRDPVEVTLLSDNATEIIMSNVGRLGYFERKTLNLRPGAYTIRGSQNGCKDIYLSIEVLPGIDPLDLRCQQIVDR